MSSSLQADNLMVDADLRVLLVEDNPGDASLVIEYLRLSSSHVVVDHVTDLAAGLAAYADHHDCVLIDLNLPDASGVEAVERFARAHPASSLVVLTGLMGGQVGVEAVRRGAAEYLHKDSLQWLSLEETLRRAAERTLLQRALAVRATQQAAVVRLGHLALSSPHPDEVLGQAVTATIEGLDVDVAGVFTLVDETRVACLRAGQGWAVPIGTELPYDAPEVTLALLSASEESTMVITDLAGDPRVDARDVFARSGAASAACAPIRLHGVTVGAVGVGSARPRDFDSDDVHFLESIANVLSASAGRAADAEELQRMALTDRLTGLPNRRLFHDRLERALSRHEREGNKVGVLFADLDNFKDINDALGHVVGDEMLRIVAERLGSAVRAADTLARLGGDEFGLLCESLDSPSDALALAERLLAALSAGPVVVGGQSILPNISIGVALGAGGQASDVIRDADAAMYRAKRQSGSAIALFDETMQREALSRLRVTEELRAAIGGEQFELVYQPEVNLRGQDVWAEALLRWRHPTRGLLAPSEFMELAERSGLIVPIGAWVIADALAQAARWRHQHGPSTVSINLSARQLTSEGLVELVAGELDRWGLDAASVWFEATETAVMSDPAQIRAVLDQIKELGVGLALDDFGTGYSSLVLARQLPIDALKIDRMFVSGAADGLSDQLIVENVIQLAHGLGLLAIAEGVETSQQLASLTDLGCDYAQGYLLARPMAPEEMVPWQRTRRGIGSLLSSPSVPTSPEAR